MQKELRWQHQKAHIWWGEIPDWSYEQAHSVRRQQQTTQTTWMNQRLAALEFLKPVGPMSLYGGLSVIFTPDKSGQFTVIIPYSDKDGHKWNGSLAAHLDEVHRGLPAEFVDGIAEGFIDVDAHVLLGMGVLHIRGAVYGAINSSRYAFRILGRGTARLLSREERDLADSDLLQLFQ